jgi:hypothetical protein
MVPSLPPPDSMAEFIERIRCLCVLLRCSMTSGMRTSDRNTMVGGARRSKHLVSFGGLAVDLVPDDDSTETRTSVVTMAKQFGLWAVDEMDHVHIQGKEPGG